MRNSIRIVLMLAVVAVLSFVNTETALAKAPPSRHEITGVINAIDRPASPPTVTIVSSESLSVTLKITTSTVITKAGLGRATIDDLVMGDRAIAGYDEDTLLANRIIVSRPLVKHRTFVGTIKSMASTNFVMATEKQGEVTINVNTGTKYGVPGVKDATLDSFKAGDKITVLAVEADSGNLALHVKLIPGRPIFVQRVGTITGLEPSNSITLQDKKGELSVFTINSDTKILFKKGGTELKIGERATVIARRVPGTEQFLAKDILVFGSGQPEPGK